jgi:hypothetical protein
MKFMRRASRMAIVTLGLVLVTLALVRAVPPAQNPTVSSHTWETTNSSPGAELVFDCIFEAKWPCKTSTGPAPSVDQILAKWEESLGGAAALAKVKTRVLAQRRFQDVGAPEDHYLLRYTKMASSDGSLESIMSHTSLDGKFMHWTDGCNPTDGFRWPGRQAKNSAPIGGEPCNKRLYFLYGYGYFPLDVNYLKKFYRFEYHGIHKIFQPAAGPIGEMASGKGPDIIPDYRAREAYLLLSIPNEGNDYEWLYFDTQTGLLLRLGGANIPRGEQAFIYAGEGDANGKFTAAGFTSRVTDFLQYRKVGDGTIMPFQFVDQSAETRVRGVTVNAVDNAPLEDSVFTKPKNAFRGDRGFGTDKDAGQ